MAHKQQPQQMLQAFRQLFVALDILSNNSSGILQHAQIKPHTSHSPRHVYNNTNTSPQKHSHNHKYSSKSPSNTQKTANIFTSLTLIQFILKVDGTQLPINSVILQNTHTHAEIHNYQIVVQQIHRYYKNQLKQQQCSKDNLQIDVKKIVIHNDKQQLCKLLRVCFILATKSSNSSYFIQKILQLNQNAQLIFAQMIKQQCNNMGNSPPRYHSPRRYKDNMSNNNNGQPKSPTLNNKGNKNTYKNIQNSTSSSTSSTVVARQHALDLIDKLYESQCMNQHLQAELAKSHTEVHQLKENVKELCQQIQRHKQQNQQLKQQLRESAQNIKIKVQKYDNNDQQHKNQQCRTQLQNLLSAYRQQIQHHTNQLQLSKRKHKQKVSELQLFLQQQKQLNKRMKQQLQYYQNQMQQLLNKYTEIQKLQKQNNIKIQKLNKKIQQIQQNNSMLKFQISYKNVQLQQMRELLAIDLSIGVADCSNSSIKDHNHEDCEDKQCEDDSSIVINKDNIVINGNNNTSNRSRRTRIGGNYYRLHTKSSKILTQDYLQLTPNSNTNNRNNKNHIQSSPNLRKTMNNNKSKYTKVQVQQMDKLKNEIKQLKKQNQSIKVLKNTVKQLEYQRNKLSNILKQYQNNRGEENQIITGCLYELRLKMANNISNSNNSKINFSRSTDHGHDISN